MIYTTRKPTEDGWYWVRRKRAGDEIVHVEGGIAYGTADWSLPVADLHRHVLGWAGPIRAPVMLGEVLARLAKIGEAA